MSVLAAARLTPDDEVQIVRAVEAKLKEAHRSVQRARFKGIHSVASLERIEAYWEELLGRLRIGQIKAAR